MTDVEWTIGTDGGDVTVARLEAETLTTLTRGQEQTVVVGFDDAADYRTLVDYLDYATMTVTDQAIDGTPLYRGLASTDPLLSFDPTGSNHPSDVVGWWAALVGGSDETLSTTTGKRLELELFILAELSEHADRTAAKDTHQV